MKKLLFLILVAVLLYGVILFAPVGIFMFQASSLEFSDNALYEQLAALTSVTVIENAGETNPAPQAVTVTLTEEDLENLLNWAFKRKEHLLLHVNWVHTEISPEMVFLEISYQYGWGKYGSVETTIFSQWLVDIFPPQTAGGKSSHIGVMPVEMHTNHLYSVNLAQLWPYLVHTTRENPWLIVPASAQFQLEDMSLQEHELSVNLIW